MRAAGKIGGRRWRAPRTQGLLPATLRGRLALSMAALLAMSFAITFVAVYRGTASSLAQQIDRDIAGDAGELGRALLESPSRSSHELALAAGRYVLHQPYTGSSTLLFALIPGSPPVTNQPELLAGGVSPDEGETAAEQLQENRAGAALLRARAGYTTLALPDVGRLRLLRQRLRIPGGPTIAIGVGQSLSSVSAAQAGVARAFILAGVLVLVCALLAAYLLGARLSSPLRQVADVAARVDAGDLHPRIHDLAGAPEEVRVLGDALNHMLDRLSDAFAGQRAFVADASHELRTPLTVIRGQLELLASQPDPPGEEVRRVEALVQAEVARIGRLVDDMLRLATAERPELMRPQPIDLESYIRELWESAVLLGRRHFELGEICPGTLRADPDQLAQALRNLLLNAVEHTADPDGLVRLSARASPAGEPAHPPSAPGEGRRVRLVIDDDGPGIPDDQRELVFNRFHRTDLARDRRAGGAGLGLAIVQAIAASHGGWVAATRSPAGGARVELELPGFTPRPGSGAQAAAANGGAGRPRAPSRPRSPVPAAPPAPPRRR